MLDVTASGKPAAPKAVTTKHLANELAEQHQLTKTQALEILEDMIGCGHPALEEGRAGEVRRAWNSASA